MEFGVIEWYCNEQTFDILGFYPYKSGFYVIGGPTGSHHSGHSDNASEKAQEIRSQGYVPINEAIEKGIVKPDWQPPKISSYGDRRLIAHIDKIEGYMRYQYLKPWWVFN